MGLPPTFGLELCAGIAGIGLGLERAIPGYRTVCAVEIEAANVAILAARQQEGSLPPFPVWDDIKTFNGKPWRGVVHIVAAGYPCQPFSVAGRRAGTDDPRHLFPHVARILGEVRPPVVFLENVAGHLSLGFEEVGESLQALGYRFAAGIFRASDVGTTHRRERLFIVGTMADARNTERRQGNEAGGRILQGEYRSRQAPGSIGINGSVLVNPQSQRWTQGRPEPAVRGGWDSAASPGSGNSEGVVAHPNDARLALWHGVGPDTRQECQTAERAGCTLHTVPPPPGPADLDGWRAYLAAYPDLAPAIERPLRRGTHDASRRLDRLRALGNAVVPDQAALAFRFLWQN